MPRKSPTYPAGYVPYKLFVDDERNPPDRTWIVSRSAQDARGLILELGLPMEMSFDYILNGKAKDPADQLFESGYTLACWIINDLINDRVPFYERGKTKFSYTVHSQFDRAKELQRLLDNHFKGTHTYG